MNAIKISVIVQSTHEREVRAALGKAGAGKVGNYTNCQFVTKGEAQFEPEDGADPAIGEVRKLDVVEAVQIQTWCSPENLESVIRAVKEVHPNEEPAIEVFPFEMR